MNQLREMFQSGWANMASTSDDYYKTEKSMLDTAAEANQKKIKQLSEQIEELSSNRDDSDEEISAPTWEEVR